MPPPPPPPPPPLIRPFISILPAPPIPPIADPAPIAIALAVGPIAEATAGAADAKGHQHSKQLAQEAQQKSIHAQNALKQRYGLDQELGEVKPHDPGYQPDFRTSREKMGSSAEHRHFGNQYQFNTGGQVLHHREPNVKDTVTPGKTILLKGPGKGQDDTIETQCLPGDFIVDARSTSNLGDGSTDSGYRELQRFVKQVEQAKGGKAAVRHVIQKAVRHKPVPVALSNDEVKLDASISYLLGNGDPVKGGKIIQGAINNLRMHKTKNRTTIPPKAKPFIEYFPDKIKKEIR